MVIWFCADALVHQIVGEPLGMFLLEMDPHVFQFGGDVNKGKIVNKKQNLIRGLLRQGNKGIIIAIRLNISENNRCFHTRNGGNKGISNIVSTASQCTPGERGQVRACFQQVRDVKKGLTQRSLFRDVRLKSAGITTNLESRYHPFHHLQE